MFFTASPVFASEIFGNISTNPAKIEKYPGTGASVSSGAENKAEKEEKKPLPAAVSGNNPVPLFAQNDKEQNAQEKVITLGLSAYVDGALLRGEDKKIYLIANGYKIHIRSLKKLQEFAGQSIYEASDNELEEYKTKKNFINELIREQGSEKVFLITKNGLKHVLNPEELRAHYFRQEIFNISREEFGLY